MSWYLQIKVVLNNIIIVCKKYCTEVIKSELARKVEKHLHISIAGFLWIRLYKNI